MVFPEEKTKEDPDEEAEQRRPQGARGRARLRVARGTVRKRARVKRQGDRSNGGKDERDDDDGAEVAAGGDWGRRFGGLHDIPDGELIPAAAATIALESCFLGGIRERAMEIVWQVRDGAFQTFLLSIKNTNRTHTRARAGSCININISAFCCKTPCTLGTCFRLDFRPDMLSQFGNSSASE